MHIVLFLLTLATTTGVGARMHESFMRGRATWDLSSDWNPFAGLPAHPERLLDGLPFSVSLLFILSVHELGHMVACWRYGVDASLPYFIPAPTLFGTMGAFIRLKSPFYTRKSLFDVGIWGPFAGFIVAVPFVIAGLAMSRVEPGMYGDNAMSFDFPPLFLLVSGLFHPGVSQYDIALHPVARAACIGMFATAMNLLPAGQLDGGHILYALSPRWHRVVSLFVGLLLALPMVLELSLWGLSRWWHTLGSIADTMDDFYWPGWFLWGLLLLVLGRRHPPVYDPYELGRGRVVLAAVALVVFILCWAPVPFRTF